MIPDKVERVVEDQESPSVWSAEYFNQFVNFYNALRKLEVIGGKVIWSDSNVKIQFSGSGATNTPTTSSITMGSGSAIYCISRWT